MRSFIWFKLHPKTTYVHYVIKISVYLQKLPNYDDKFSVGQALMLQ